MFLKNLSAISLSLAMSVLASAVCPAFSGQDKPAVVERTVLVGRVLASINSLGPNSDLTARYETFVFAVESIGESGIRITPVRILYRFHSWDERLRDPFFDYSKRYEMQVEREPRCDETLRVLSYEKNEDENGKELPPTNILRMMDGAPKDLLKPDSILPCYMLRTGNRSQTGGQAYDFAIPVPEELN